MKFRPKVGDLVYIRWSDHSSYTHAGWRQIEDIASCSVNSICETVGFVLHLTPDRITTASSIAFWDNGDDCSQICTRLRREITHGKVIARFPRPKDV